MKKILLTIIFILILVSMTACMTEEEQKYKDFCEIQLDNDYAHLESSYGNKIRCCYTYGFEYKCETYDRPD